MAIERHKAKCHSKAMPQTLQTTLLTSKAVFKKAGKERRGKDCVEEANVGRDIYTLHKTNGNSERAFGSD